MLENLQEWELIFIITLQGLGDWPVIPMNLFTFLGNREFYLLIMPALYWCWDTRLGLRVGLAFLLSTTLAFLLKMAVHASRPYWLEPRVRLLTTAESTFGLPSGHAQNAVVTWGLIAAYGAKSGIWVGAVALMFFIGLSRPWLGVHYLTDVITGWLLGGIFLFLFLRLEKPATLWLGRQSSLTQLAVVFAVSLGLTLLGILLRSNLITAWQLPPIWIENAARYTPDEPLNPLGLDDLIASTAAFFGLAAGAILLGPSYEFETTGPWGQRLGRYLVGIVGVLFLWRGLGLIFDLVAPGETLPAYTLRYVRYTLVGLWISALGPLLFVRLGLMSGRANPLAPFPNL